MRGIYKWLCAPCEPSNAGPSVHIIVVPWMVTTIASLTNWTSIILLGVTIALTKYECTWTCWMSPWPQATWLTCSTRTTCSQPVPCVTSVRDPIKIVPSSVVTLSITWCGGHTAWDNYTWQNEVVPYLNAIMNTSNKLKVTYIMNLRLEIIDTCTDADFVHDHAPSQSS